MRPKKDLRRTQSNPASFPRGPRRFYVEADLPVEEVSFRLSPRETFHLHRVLRLKSGDLCQIFNRRGEGAEAFIEEISESKGAKLRVKKTHPSKAASPFLRIGQALPQKRKMDGLVEKAGELGVQELWILETKRSIVKMRGEAAERARGRWERIVVEAAKQSGSPLLTRIEGPLAFEKVVESEIEDPDSAFLFHPDPQGLRFSEVVEALRKSVREPTGSASFLFLGPEGGFTEEEVWLAESRGVRKVFLGEPLLRVETAFLSVIGAIRFLLTES